MKKIRIEENGKVHYEGPARRGADYETSEKKILFGIFSLKDIIHIGTITVLITGFLVRAEGHIQTIQDSVSSMTKEIKYLSECQKQSDNYHSAIIGEQFDCGKPLTAVRSKSIRKMIDRENGIN